MWRRKWPPLEIQRCNKKGWLSSCCCFFHLFFPVDAVLCSELSLCTVCATITKGRDGWRVRRPVRPWRKWKRNGLKVLQCARQRNEIIVIWIKLKWFCVIRQPRAIAPFFSSMKLIYLSIRRYCVEHATISVSNWNEKEEERLEIGWTVFSAPRIGLCKYQSFAGKSTFLKVVQQQWRRSLVFLWTNLRMLFFSCVLESPVPK